MHLTGMGFAALKTRSSIGVIGLIALFAAAISAVSVAGQGAKEPPQPPKADARVAHKVALAGVSNFGEVTPTLYRGAHPTEAGFERLAELGIQVVVDVRVVRTRTNGSNWRSSACSMFLFRGVAFIRKTEELRSF